MEKSPFERYREQRRQEQEMEGDMAKVAQALNDYNNTNKTPEDRAQFFKNLEENELGARDAANWWYRRACALRYAIETYERSKGEIEDVRILNDNLEMICTHETFQMKMAKKVDVNEPMYEVQQRVRTGLMLEDLAKELAVTGVNTNLAFTPTHGAFVSSKLGGGFRRGELACIGVLHPQPIAVDRHLYNTLKAGPVIRIIDEKIYPTDADGDTALPPGRLGEELQRKAMIGNTIYGIDLVCEPKYDPPVEVADDIPVDQNPNYRQQHGPGKSKTHIRRGRASSLFQNLFDRSTSTKK